MKNIKDAGAVATIKCVEDVKGLGMNIKKARTELNWYVDGMVKALESRSRSSWSSDRYSRIPDKISIRIFSDKNYFLDLKRDYFDLICEEAEEELNQWEKGGALWTKSLQKLLKKKGYKDLAKQMIVDEIILSSENLKYCLDDILPIVAEPELLNKEVKRWSDTHLCQEDYLVERLRRYLDTKENLDELIAQRLEEGLKWWALK